MLEAIGNFFSGLFVPAVIAALVILVFAVVLRLLKSNYIKVPPHEVAVISGRKHKITVRDVAGAEQVITVGYRLVKGGAAFVWPFFERVDLLDLREITIANLVVKDAITAKGVKLSVKAVANIKIGSEDTLLSNAVERLLGKKQEDIRQMVYETLEAHLRSILGTLTIEDVNSNRAEFQQRMVKESKEDLAQLGIKIDSLLVKELSDDVGYLNALGIQQTAEIKRDANIGEAEALRESTIKSTTSHREGEVQHQGNIALEAKAEKETNVQKANFDAETQAAQARAAQAGPLATAEARKEVVRQEQEVELARTRKATEVAQAEADRKAQELLATTVRPAEADKAASIARAEGEAQAIRIKADAERQRLSMEGQGHADAIRAKMLAEAEGTRAQLLAEAEGVLRKADAYKQLNEAGQLLQILEAAQMLIPNAIEKFGGVMQAAAAPLGQADKIILVDSGGNGSGAVERFAGTIPSLVFGLLEKTKAVGLDLTGALKHMGVQVAEETNRSAEPNP